MAGGAKVAHINMPCRYVLLNLLKKVHPEVKTDHLLTPSQIIYFLLWKNVYAALSSTMEVTGNGGCQVNSPLFI